MNPRLALCITVAVVLLTIGCDDDGPTKPKNTAPTASFMVTPSSGTTETDFQFDASGCSDLNDPDTALVMRWDWEDDGTWDTAFSTMKTATHRYGTTGTKTIKMEVKDTGGLTGQTTRSVTVGEAPPDGMVLIPAGTFTMGSDPGEGGATEEPEHQPYISAFYMDLYEVTNTMYLTALIWAFDQGRVYWNGSDVVKSASDAVIYLEVSSYCRIDHSGSAFVVESGYADHPVVEVSWYGAAAYCNWRSEREGLEPCYDTSTWECNFSADGYRLPTEAEWEKAARGPSDERTYPWGEETPDCGRVNARIGDHCVGDTAPVGSYPSGVSPYSLYDMAGNAFEWCNDWSSSTYYSSSPATDPLGPSSGTRRVARGGSWIDYENTLRCASRGSSPPSLTFPQHGFRCVRSQ